MVDLGEVAVAGVEGVLLVMSPLEFPRILLDVFGVVAIAGGVAVDVVAVGVELVEFIDDPGGPPVLLLLFRGGGAFLLLWPLSDLPFLDLLLVRFSATRSFRTHSSYLKRNNFLCFSSV